MRRLLLLLALLASPAVARPALWVAEDTDTTVYLFGTVHALPPAYRWEDARLKAAFDRAGTLVIETKVEDAAGMAALLLQLGTPARPLPPLLERVRPALRPQVAALIARGGAPAALYDRLETWAAAFLLVQPLMADLGVSAADGVEERLKAEFTARGAAVEELETVREQLGYVDGLAEADQRALLEGFVGQARTMRREFAAMVAAWARGDEAAMARDFDRELKGSPGLRAALLERRNARWAAALAERMRTRPGTLLVAVGAGHLAGRGSVVERLRAAGFTVRRVQ